MLCTVNPLSVVLTILGWGLVAVVAIVVIAVIIALLRGVYGVFTSAINRNDDNGRN